MPRPTILTLILALVLGLASCGDKHEALAKESIGLMQEFGDTLAKVTDKASAESHSAELEGLVTDMKDIQVRMEKMEEPSEEKEAELRKKLDAEMAPAVQKMTQEMMRVSQNPEIMLVLGPIFQKMQD